MSKSIESGLEYLAGHADHMVKDLDTLIRLDTCFPPGNSYNEIVDVLEDLCGEIKGTARRISIPESLWATPGVHGDRNNLIYSPELPGCNEPSLSIYFHTDTAPVGDGWTYPPLKLTETEGKLIGRGSADMKGCIAAVLAVLRAVVANQVGLKFQPQLLFCTDEEGGLYPGIRYLAEQGLIDGTLLNLNGSAVPRIWAGCFGSLDFQVKLKGRSAHSGTPWLGINALEAALPVMAALMRLKGKVEQRRSALPAPPGSHEPLYGLLTITAASAGSKGSALPGMLTLNVNRRYPPEESANAVEDEFRITIEQAVARSALLDCSIDVVGHLPPVIDPDGPLTQPWTLAQSVGYGVSLREFVRFGSSTSSDFGWVQKAGIQHMMLGGLSRPSQHIHGPDEYTTRTDLIGLARSVFLMLSADFTDEFQGATGAQRDISLTRATLTTE